LFFGSRGAFAVRRCSCRAQEDVAVRRDADTDLLALDVQDDDAEVAAGLVVELLLVERVTSVRSPGSFAGICSTAVLR
jgi:hypothetical protein